LRDVDAATSVCDTYAAERQRYGVLLNPSKSPAPPPPAHAQCPPSLDDLSLLAATLQGSNRRLAHSSNSLSNHSSLGTGNSGNAGIDDFETSKSTSSPEFDSIQQEAHRRRATTAPTHLAAAAPSARQAAEARAWKAGLYADLGPGCGVPEPDPDSHVEQLIHKVRVRIIYFYKKRNLSFYKHNFKGISFSRSRSKNSPFLPLCNALVGMRTDMGILSSQEQSCLSSKGLVSAPTDCLLAPQ